MQNNHDYVNPNNVAINDLTAPIKGEKVLVKMAANLFSDIAEKSLETVKEMKQSKPSISEQFAIVSYWEDYLKKSMAASCFLDFGIKHRQTNKKDFIAKLNKKESLSNNELASIQHDFEKICDIYKQNKSKINDRKGHCSHDEMFDALSAIPNQESLERSYLASMLVNETSSKEKNSLYNEIQGLHAGKDNLSDKIYVIENNVMSQAADYLTKEGFHIKGEELEIILDQIKDANHNMNVIKQLPSEDKEPEKDQKTFTAKELVCKVKHNLFSMNSDIGIANEANQGLEENPYFMGVAEDALKAINGQITKQVFIPLKSYYSKLEKLRYKQDKVGDVFDQARTYNNKYAYYKKNTQELANNVKPIKNKDMLIKILNNSRN